MVLFYRINRLSIMNHFFWESVNGRKHSSLFFYLMTNNNNEFLNFKAVVLLLQPYFLRFCILYIYNPISAFLTFYQ